MLRRYAQVATFISAVPNVRPTLEAAGAFKSGGPLAAHGALWELLVPPPPLAAAAKGTKPGDAAAAVVAAAAAEGAAAARLAPLLGVTYHDDSWEVSAASASSSSQLVGPVAKGLVASVTLGLLRAVQSAARARPSPLWRRGGEVDAVLRQALSGLAATVAAGARARDVDRPAAGRTHKLTGSDDEDEDGDEARVEADERGNEMKEGEEYAPEYASGEQVDKGGVKGGSQSEGHDNSNGDGFARGGPAPAVVASVDGGDDAAVASIVAVAAAAVAAAAGDCSGIEAAAAAAAGLDGMMGRDGPVRASSGETGAGGVTRTRVKGNGNGSSAAPAVATSNPELEKSREQASAALRVLKEILGAAEGGAGSRKCD